MRNFERLQGLPSTIAAGLQSGEVVLALDRAMAGETPTESERGALEAGEALLRHLANPEIRGTVGRTRGAQHLMSAGTALDAIEVVQAASVGKDFNTFVTGLADVISRALEQGVAADDEPALRSVLNVFSHLGDLELARANTLLRTREELVTWPSSMTTSPS